MKSEAHWLGIDARKQARKYVLIICTHHLASYGCACMALLTQMLGTSTTLVSFMLPPR